MSTPPILGLDVDGVLHPAGPVTAESQLSRLPLLTAWLRHRPGIDIVVTSTWRLSRTLGELRALVPSDLRERVIGATPALAQELWEEYGGELPPVRHPREAELRRWLADSRTPWRDWVALDDEPWLYTPGCSRLVVCQASTGLTYAALELLDQLVNRLERNGRG